MDRKLTPWFPESVKPVRKGLYMVQDYSIHCNCCYFDAHWNGKEWHTQGLTFYNVWKHGVTRWRGLAVKP